MAHTPLLDISPPDESRELQFSHKMSGASGVSDVPLLPQNILQFADGGKNYKPPNLCWVPAWLIVLQIHKANCYQKEKSSLSATYLAPA